MHKLKIKEVIVSLALCLCIFIANGQKEIAAIPIDPSLNKVDLVMQFSDTLGNVLFSFQDGEVIQFTLVKKEGEIESKTIAFIEKPRYAAFLEKENELSIFYRMKKTMEVFEFTSDLYSLPNAVSPTDILSSENKALLDVFHKDEFYIFHYTISPFTISSYRYISNNHFEKKIQSFQSAKSERYFLGRILTDDEIIFVRYSINPLTFHLYRFNERLGFEKKSFKIASCFENAGLKGNRLFLNEHISYSTSNELNRRIELDAFVSGDTIYLNLEDLIIVENNPAKAKNRGVLKLDWTSSEGMLLRYDEEASWKYIRRSSVIYKDRYFKLLVNKSRLTFSIFDLERSNLLKSYNYVKGDKIELIYGQTLLTRNNLSLSINSTLFIPLMLNKAGKDDVSNENVLKEFSKGDLYMDANGDGNIIELFIGSTYEKGSFFRVNDSYFVKSGIKSFLIYLKEADISLIENMEFYSDPHLKLIDNYLNELEAKDVKLGKYLFYKLKNKLFLAYIDKQLRECKVIEFEFDVVL